MRKLHALLLPAVLLALALCLYACGDGDGDKETIVVALTRTLTMALVEEDGGWKLDEIVRFARLDPSRLADQMAENLESGQGPAEPRAIDCIRRTFGEKSRPELEELFIGGSELPLLKILDSCESRG